MDKFDLLVMGGANDAPQSPVDVSILRAAGMVSGSRSAVQKWTIAFITISDTVVGEEGYGTSLLPDLAGRNITADKLVEDAVVLAIRDTDTWMSYNAPVVLDEVKGVEFVGFKFINGDISITLKFTLADSKTINVVVPVTKVT